MRRVPWFAALRVLLVGLTALVAVGAAVLYAKGEEGGREDGARHSLADTTRSTPSTPGPGPGPALPTGSPVLAEAEIRAAPPQLMAITTSSVPDETVRRVAGLKGVRKAAAVDGGTVHIAGNPLQLLAVDPATFRSWTPQPVAEHPEVWSALSRGELVADAETVRRLGMNLGAQYQVDGGPRLRLAASAALGLPAVDGLISTDLGRSFGFSPGVVVLIHGASPDARRVKRVLGAKAHILAVQPGKREKTTSEKKAGKTAKTGGKTGGGTSTGGGGTGQGLVGRPASYLELYRRSAGVCPGLSWSVLAAIGQVESGHGRNNGPSSAGALGPMQFMPATWKTYGVDGDGDGKADIWSAYDAVPSAAKYLCANGAAKGGEKLRKAVWFYNHSWDYVNRVLGLAEAYARAYS
ncbi:lytic transglycosylase domain-containing protein [Microtetraspora malaysiensis]|uniref:lytic transglycosylase domain-containing protein n=1 Tax=Microtetraspora malaysiensis TaxID=161358 RepID=UPI00083046EA|nr:lytic transglycosylase domain-containing protein [Microtetraspora malaysiensis]